MSEPPIFIGCACNRKYVEHTAVMLVSLDLHGELPEAPVILAGFNLQEGDRSVLRTAAGRRELRILDITRDAMQEVKPDRFTAWYPLSVLGRLLVPEHVGVAGARMLTLDSDMIVNGSLRPLVYRDLGEDFFAAVHDAPRIHDLTYFNSGLTLFDVDAYRHWDVGHRCLRWLGEQEHQPGFPDQDALNAVVGHLWHRLARTWNYFNYESSGFVTEDYELCRIAHFAGPKPWQVAHHPGRPLYQRYLAALNDRIAA